jgi:hypothetical protein
MSKFIKFSNFLLNTNDIHRIIIQPNKYCIHIVSKKMSGFNWGINGFGLGYISSDTSEIEVCKTNHSIDYKILSDWIRKNG